MLFIQSDNIWDKSTISYASEIGLIQSIVHVLASKVTNTDVISDMKPVETSEVWVGQRLL